MRQSEVRRACRAAVAAGTVHYDVHHALPRMRERHVTSADVENVLKYASSVQEQPDNRWRLAGKNVDGDRLEVVVCLDEGVVVITVIVPR